MANSKKALKAANVDLGKGLRRELKKLLNGGQAHADFEDAVKGMPAKLRGVMLAGLPYSAWQIVEHIRIAQRDILDFCRNEDGRYKPRKWPQDYWPKQAEPQSTRAWEKSIKAIRADRVAFEKLLKAASDKELVTPFVWGDGQTLLREVLLVADHMAYHVGELIVLRRLLGAWKT
jgi:uncharacterized damage-inducible protein DinB